MHDYTRKRGVEHCEIIVPAAATWARDREALWNAAELAEVRRNATVAREYELALPAELSATARIALVREFGRAISDRYAVAADVAIHAPHRLGDQRNWHAHVMTTSRTVERDGLGVKTRVLDSRQSGPAEVVAIRAIWEAMANAALERHGVEARVDYRSLQRQREEAETIAASHRAVGDIAHAEMASARAESLDRPVAQHAGPGATNIERRAQREAIAAGTDYQPATDIGARIHAAMKAKKAAEAAFFVAATTLAAIIREWVREARQWIAHARVRAAVIERERGVDFEDMRRVMADIEAKEAAIQQRQREAARRRDRERLPGDE